MTKPTLYCSFCGKAQYEVEYLFAGPNAFICTECVVLCTKVTQERRMEKDPYCWYDPVTGEV